MEALVTCFRFAGLGIDERLIYQLIEASKDRGIWVRDLRIKSNLQQNQISKCLKILEGRKLVKAVKSIAGKSKRVCSFRVCLLNL